MVSAALLMGRGAVLGGGGRGAKWLRCVFVTAERSCVLCVAARRMHAASHLACELRCSARVMLTVVGLLLSQLSQLHITGFPLSAAVLASVSPRGCLSLAL